MTSESPERETHRRRIHDLDPERRKELAALIRASLLKIPGEVEQLRRNERDLVEWLTEFAPEMLPEQYRNS